MANLSGGELVIDTLVENGIDTIFGLPGVQLDPIFAALHDRQEKINIIHSRHEQGCTYMAYGYAQSTGKTGISFIVPGPGLLNAGAAIVTGYACNSPMLCFSGQLRTTQIGKGYGYLHEIPDQLATAKGLVRWGDRIRHPSQIPSKINQALIQAESGRKGPVYLEASLDTLQMTCATTQAGARLAADEEISIDEAEIEQLATLLAEAKSPVIYAGGGAIDASQLINQLCERLDCPVIMSANGLGVLDARHPNAFTPVSGRYWWEEADVILLLGTRLLNGIMNWPLSDNQTLVKVDIDPDEHIRCPKPLSHSILADVGCAVDAVLGALNEKQISSKPAQKELILTIRNKVEDDLQKVSMQREILQVIRGALGEEGILVSDLTQLYYTAQDTFPVYKPRTFIHPSYQGTLGHCVATSIGVKVGNPEKPVLALAGDGGFMFTVQELITAVQYNIPTVFLVMNDSAYGNVKRIMNQSYGGRAYCSDLTNPDFVKMAESYGMQGTRVNSVEGLRTSLDNAFSLNRPSLIEFQVGEFPDPWHLHFK